MSELEQMIRGHIAMLRSLRLMYEDGFMQVNDNLGTLAALDAGIAALQASHVAEAVDGEVLVTVSGLTGTGKSAVAGEIEILCRALGLEVEHDNAEERGLTHGDWQEALELYRPRVRIVERNIPRPPCPKGGV